MLTTIDKLGKKKDFLTHNIPPHKMKSVALPSL